MKARSESVKSKSAMSRIPESPKPEENEKGTTEIISKYHNVQINEIVTNLDSNEVTEISKITKEALLNIIGGYYECPKKPQKPFNTLENINFGCSPVPVPNIENHNASSLEMSRTKDQLDSPENIEQINNRKISKFVKRKGNPSGQCYVRIELDETLESMQENIKNNSQMKNGLLITKLIGNLSTHGNSHMRIAESSIDNGIKDCFVKLELNQSIEQMQSNARSISQKSKKPNGRKFVRLFSNEKLSNAEINKVSSIELSKQTRKRSICDSNDDGKNNASKNFRDQNESDIKQCNEKCSTFISKAYVKRLTKKIEYYRKKNNKLLLENMKYRNSLAIARNKIKQLNKHLINLKRNKGIILNRTVAPELNSKVNI